MCRVVPISDNLAAAIDEWSEVNGGEDFVLRGLWRSKKLGKSTSSVALFNVQPGPQV
jgi:hypothetical protein